MSTPTPRRSGHVMYIPLDGADPDMTTLLDSPDNGAPNQLPTTLDEALARMVQAEDTLRAIGAGEIDAFVISDRAAGQSVFTLSTADRPYRLFVENMRDGAATLSESGLILYANERLAQLLGSARDQVVGSLLSDFVLGGTGDDLRQVREARGVSTTVEFDLLASDRTRVPVLVGISPLEIEGRQLSCLTFADLSAQKAQDREIARLGLVQAERLTELQGAQAALTQQATHDTLTGLPNRALLMDRIEQALAQAKRSHRCTAVFFIDLDRFKQVNDTHGHAAGDEVLKLAGRRLGSALRMSDTVARIGGDEFVVLAQNVDNELHAVDIGARLVAELGNPTHSIADGGPLTASIGIAVSLAGRATAESLLNEADAAMYQAKSQGGGRAEIFDAALGLQAQQQSAARQVLQSALDQNRIVAYYQPIIDLSTGRSVGFEALARISARDGAIVPPSAFIPIAEESGLVVPLGSEMVQLACLEANSWPRPAWSPERLTVAVNLSSRQFEGGDLVGTVQNRLDQTGLAPERLHLELTETATIDLRHNVLLQLGKLRDLGVEIGLDDFGTGYGSLTHLRRLPLTFVKIDRSFVSGLGTDVEDERIVSAVANLAANLGLRSIAEGVETPDQLSFLRAIGCDQAQGYLFGRPMPLRDIPQSLLADPW